MEQQDSSSSLQETTQYRRLVGAGVVYSVVVGARNRTYPIPIPCSESIPEPIPMLELIPIPKLVSERIPELNPEPILELVPEPIPDSTPESIPGSESAPESESSPEPESTWESQFAPSGNSRNGVSSGMRISF